MHLRISLLAIDIIYILVAILHTYTHGRLFLLNCSDIQSRKPGMKVIDMPQQSHYFFLFFILFFFF